MKLDLGGCRARDAGQVAATARPRCRARPPTASCASPSTAMSYAVKAVTTERGLDAGSFTMVVYGGAGPLHASAIAREIGIRKVLDSLCARLFLGLRHAVRRPALRLRALRASASSTTCRSRRSKRSTRDMEDEGRAAIARPRASSPTDIVIDARRRHALRRPGARRHRRSRTASSSQRKDRAAIKAEFDDVHEVRYGTSAPDEPADLVSLRVTVIGIMRKPPTRRVATQARRADAARCAATSRSTSATQAASSTRRSTCAISCAPATGSTVPR